MDTNNIVIEKLTQRDRDNINFLANMYDIIFSGRESRKGKGIVEYNRDFDILLSRGFKLGPLGGSLWGKDKYGREWCVGTTYRFPSYNGGAWTDTTWYLVDERGLRHKQLPGLTWEKFDRLFKEK
jgi:hypothetical protein